MRLRATSNFGLQQTRWVPAKFSLSKVAHSLSCGGPIGCGLPVTPERISEVSIAAKSRARTQG
jgi:hypothetical protein